MSPPTVESAAVGGGEYPISMPGPNTRAVLRVYGGVTLDAIGLAAAVRSDAPAGERERLGALFDMHYARLYRLARRLAPTADDAKDLVQETFVRAARVPGAVPHGLSSEEAWLVRVLVNICRDGWRRRATRQRTDVRRMTDVHATAESSHEDAYIARTTVWRALDALPPRQRAVIVLHELEDVGIKEVASLLGISAVTVRWHLSMGRRALAFIIRSNHGHG